MNILHLHEQIDIKGGSEVYLNELLNHSPNYDITAHWLAIEKKNNTYTTKYTNTPLPAKITPQNVKNISLFIQDFCSKHKIDVIHIHGLSNYKIINKCLEIKPVVRSMHEPRMICPGHGKFWAKSEKPCNITYGMHCFWHAYSQKCVTRHPVQLLKSYYNTWYEINKASKQYKQIIVMSGFMEKEAIAAGITKDKITINPYFTESIKDITFSTNNKKNILFSGRISHEKGPHYLLEAVSPLLNKYNDLSLTYVGDGLMKKTLKELIKEKKVEDKVKLISWAEKKKLNKLYNTSYIIVIPSLYPEAFGIVGIEAMMHKKPVIAFDVGGISDWLKNEGNGYLVKQKNITELKNKIEKLITNKELYKQFAKMSRELALNRFTPQKHMSILLKVYKNALR